jgi:cytochrome c556|tara:strand:+ start:597 stop:1049 length:453 start_codon:yes stop_codon:yes gene_type:complete
MKNILQLLVAIIFIALSINLYADDISQEKLIKERKAMFKQNYSYAKKMSSEITKGNNQAVSDLALKMSKNYELLINFFPENTQTGYETEALPSIWEEKELFNELMNKASNDAGDFATMAMNLMGDELKDHQKKMIWSQCKTCHDKFRMPH